MTGPTSISLSKGPKSVRRQSSESDPTRRRLLEAAGDLFGRHGFHATSVRDICRAADVNSAAVSYHFGGKAELYRAVAMAVSDDIASSWPKAGTRVADYPSVEAALDHVVQSLVAPSASAQSRVSMVQIGNWEKADPTGLIDDIVRPRVEPVLTLIRELIRECAPEPPGALRESVAALGVLQLAATATQGERIWPWFGCDALLGGSEVHSIVCDLLRQFIRSVAPKPTSQSTDALDRRRPDCAGRSDRPENDQ